MVDSLGHTMTSVVINPFFDWGSDHPPRIPYHQTIIYEAHVKGMTQTHPRIPEELRGTYSGLAHPAVIEHLKSLNVTAIELMPIHQFMHDKRLLQLGLQNYWGYNTFGFFAPHYQYAATHKAGSAVAEFKSMVRSFHNAGIEVILDVVYNHTAEGDHLGPTINFRGIDNAAYYRLLDGDLRHYKDFTGTGNSLNARHPHTLQLIMDSLRYWVLEMHVDGFRFDLASTLAREFYDVDRLSAFFDLVQQDPVISQVKLIAEPWDIGEGGYQVGNAYREKHNEANGEGNRDGESHNRSWNCGVEGPTDDPEILALRHRQMRNIMATLMLSQGTPMISHGDEIGRTQRGNNNGYCQDNEVTWMDWDGAGQYADILAFTCKMTALRVDHPVFRRRRFFDGRPSASPHQMRDIYWLTCDGVEMTSDDWHSGIKSVAVGLNGEALREPDARGERIIDDSFLLCFNAHAYAIDFVIPETPYAREWQAVIDTFHPQGATEQRVAAGDRFTVQGRSVVVLQKTG